MTEQIEEIEKLIAECSTDEQKVLKQRLSTLVPHPLEKEWGIDAETILTAIRRSSDLTKRGVRGIIAEAVFENSVSPSVEQYGWRPTVLVGDLSYDAQLKKGVTSARIQIKLQRLEKGMPKLYYPRHYDEGSLYVVEVQKTRSGEKTTKQILQGSDTTLETPDSITLQTRPYRFGDFDILAVNMHPSSGDWKNFRYTVASWLLPRLKDENLIEIFQPVAAVPNDVWTDDLATCLGWFESGEKHRVLTDLLHLSR
ncbi:hypothetical protein RBB75_17280 [Tunturibacter empetritectus]|uniref:Uncharacterized protein n=1 Tax=Tunturiibacter empetritectus TaxID=3069691 RepID=A0AAU7ZB77_9BACT